MPEPRREGHSKEMTDRIRDKLQCLFLIRFFALSGLLQEDEKMDFLNGRIKTIYFRYLSAAFGSALITSIYSIVDMAMVGQYHGPEGSAALAVVAPVWNIIYSFGLLMGIGGSVIFSTIRGKADGNIKKSNEYFTVSVIGSVVLAVIIWLIVIFFDRELLIVFGAQDNTLTLAREYVLPIKFAIPFFLFNQMLAAYLRNDKNPALATGAVLAGGIFNIFGDYFFVFTCDMGHSEQDSRLPSVLRSASLQCCPISSRRRIHSALYVRKACCGS